MERFTLALHIKAMDNCCLNGLTLSGSIGDVKGVGLDCCARAIMIENKARPSLAAASAREGVGRITEVGRSVGNIP